ncbi:hypothetical protein BJX68DRAFT_271432 [Aspergillus pseudodeflectus]|uniref:Rhodopsin domain-containing protein n=1 Tax=Aspergillus pseudodeflectus TaxID=176178 RepID=A0ABR4JL97_9EURO
MFLRVVGLLLFLSAATVSLRLYCRLFRVHKVGLDDYLIVAALAVTIGMGVMNGFHIAVGTGQHLSDLAPVLGQVLVPTLKHWQVIAVGIFVAVYTRLPQTVARMGHVFPEGCKNLPATYFSTAAITIFTGLVVLVMPLPQLMKPNLHRRRKYALIAIFLTGTFASAASLARLNALYKYTATEQKTYPPLKLPIRRLRNLQNGESHFRRTLTSAAGTNHGAIELTSRDDDVYARRGPSVSKSTSKRRKGTVDDENSSQKLILAQNANIMKTVVIKMTSENRR